METDELGIRQARQDFGALVNRTATRDLTTFITSHGRRVAGVVPLRVAEAAVSDRIDLITLTETMLASRGSWDWDDMIEAAAYTAYRLHRRGVQITLDGKALPNPTVAEMQRALHQRLDTQPAPEATP